MKFLSSVMPLAPTLASLLFVSCVTSQKPNENVIACPECRVVVLYLDDDAVVFDDLDPVKKRRHECPGCEGHLTTFFKEGKLEHRCSICEKSPYSCNVTHPVESL